MSESPSPPETSSYCFESAAAAELQKTLAPQQAGLIFSWEEMVARLSGEPTQSSQDRLKTLELALNETEKTRSLSWLKTIELLREALVITHQDVDTLFQVLPKTPRNQRFAEVFHHYLDSRIGEDWTLRAWSAVERVRALGAGSQLPAVFFVRGPEPSVLFSELALAYGRHTGADSLRESWQLLGEAAQPRRIRKAEGAVALEYLTRRIRRNQSQGYTTALAFAGSWAEQTYLECLLAGQSLEARIIPFVPPALPPPQVRILAYAGTSLFEFDPRDLILSGAELETLAIAGYPVATERARSERRRELYQGFASAAGVTLVCPTEKEPTRVREVRGLTRGKPSPSVDSMQAPIGRRRLSATQLELYADCPSRHFFQSCLKLQKAQPGEEESYAWVFGQAAHLALERYFLGQPQKIEPESLMEQFAVAARETVPNLDQRSTLRVTMTEHFRRIAQEIPRLESELSQVFPGHTPLLFEHKFEVSFGEQSLTGMIDRLDRLPDGSLLILDYKTGTIDFTPNHITEGSNFQALLYTLAAESLREGAWTALLFYDLKTFEVRRGLVKDFGLDKTQKARITRGHVLSPDKIEALSQVGLAHIQRIGESIARGDFTATPSRASCDRCDFPQMCRSAHGYE